MSKYVANTLSRIEAEAMAREQEIDELINMYQEAVRGLARRNYRMYDKENDDCFLTGDISYDKKTMKLLVEFDKED